MVSAPAWPWSSAGERSVPYSPCATSAGTDVSSWLAPRTSCPRSDSQLRPSGRRFRRQMTRLLLPILALMLLAAAPAQAAEQKMTLYSDPVDVRPYTGEQHYMPLKADGQHAPADPGWITSIKVDVVKKRSAQA